MKIKKIDLGQERKIIIRLITSTEYCRRVLPVIKPYYLRSVYSKIVVKWIAEFFDRYQNAPGNTIQDIFYSKKNEISEDEMDEVGEFLKSISDEFEKEERQINLDYEINEAMKYLRLQSLQYVSDQLQIAVDEGNPDGGEKVIIDYARVSEPSGEGVSILHDAREIEEAFDDEGEFLFRLPGALGEVAGDFCRGDFVSFFAPMKRGKTWWLWFLSEYAMREGLKVVFFTLEMTRKQMIRRAWRSLVGLPKNKADIEIPYFEKQDDGKYTIKMKTETRRGINPSKVEKYQKQFRILFRRGDVKIISLLGSQATVRDIAIHLDNLAFYENFDPDVVVVDYADLLDAEKSAGKEYRHQINNIWRGLRNLARDRNKFVATVSQTAKETFTRDMKQADAAEDIRKIAHVTSALGLNQREEEKARGFMRVKQLAIREGKQITDQAVVLQCLDIGKVCLDSKLLKDLKGV